jgi:predicted SnoaL-like aldol condensation-catalyzing enzyme
VRAAPATLRYEHGLILTDANWVMVQGRFSGHGRPAAWIAVDILRVNNGQLAEHWDVLQDEATEASSVSGMPMFGNIFLR